MQTCMQVSSISLREGIKGRMTFEYGNLYALLFRRSLCETGVRPFVLGWSGVYNSKTVDQAP